MIISLGTTLEEVTLDELQSNSSYSAVFLTNSIDAEEIMKIAGIVYDGEINLKNIEFCKVEAQQECIVGNLHIPRLSDNCNSHFRIQFFINQRHIVIIDDDNYARQIIYRIRHSRTRQGQTRENFMYNFITQCMSHDLELMGRYERRIMQIEEEVMDGRMEGFHSQITPLRNSLLNLREYYDELRDLGKELEENENHFFAKKNLKYFGIIADRADRLLGRSMRLLDYISQVGNSYREQVAEQQNKNMQFLTVISTIFFPLTLITGWYGMNFENMPELEHGYPGVIILSLIVIAIIIYIFKKMKIF